MRLASLWLCLLLAAPLAGCGRAGPPVRPQPRLPAATPEVIAPASALPEAAAPDEAEPDAAEEETSP